MSLQKKQWPAPAKLNLMLSIVGRYSDNDPLSNQLYPSKSSKIQPGYHLLQTLFQIVDYGDSLQFDIHQSPEISIQCSDKQLATSDNLIVKAAEALRQYSGKFNIGAQIYLDKHLPVGAGLGGGSSNAATTLVALNHLWQLQLSRQELANIGLELGADVPLFIEGHTAWAEGIGEQLTHVTLPPLWYLVIYPGCAVSTANIFSHPQLERQARPTTLSDYLSHGGPQQGYNVMEPLVTQHYPQIETALTWLKKHNKNARLTGSGSCLFSPFDNEQEASKIAALCPWEHFVAKGVNFSPLFQ